MHDDPGFSRFFACLKFIHFFDARNRARQQLPATLYLLGMVGVSSYLLVGFWFRAAIAADRGKKAFIHKSAGRLWFPFGNTEGLERFRFSKLWRAQKRMAANMEKFSAGRPPPGF
jgi:NADH:ubiquinone oxidoreductase subunit 5 (subunit L)/multisubunit Na+/H+ antiporter MnhA subunit